MPIRANIVSWESGGLGVDIDVVARALTRAGCEVFFKGRRRRHARHRVHSLSLTVAAELARQWAAVSGRPRFDVNFFVESVFPEHLPAARVNCLFVNPEWFRDENRPHMARIDLALAKAPSGIAALEGVPAPRREVGFTSPDRRLPGFVRQDGIRCLHLSGQSAVKGTEAVVEAWSRHPEWPELVVVRRAVRYGGEPAPPLPPLPNVRYETDYVPGERLRELQNACAVHVQPSQAEAYGHVIGEAMSCGAVVVTTDAPPMNELVTTDRGVLVEVARAEPMRLSTRNYVHVGDLERKLADVFALAPERRAELGHRARLWYEEQDRRFEAAMRRLIDDLPRLKASGSK